MKKIATEFVLIALILTVSVITIGAATGIIEMQDSVEIEAEEDMLDLETEDEFTVETEIIAEEARMEDVTEEESGMEVLPEEEAEPEDVADAEPEIGIEEEEDKGEQNLIPPHSAIVRNYEELRDALGKDNGINTVYFADDIKMMLGGIRINPKKQEIVISGLNPLDPTQSEPYTLTDYSSASFYDTLYIDAVGISSIKVCDLNITGKNFYGPVSVYDSASLESVLIIYERVNYNGPQMAYHRRGRVQIKDCTVKIHGGNGGSANQEFSEVKHLLFEGDNVIDTLSNAYTVFWHPSGGTFTLTKNSSLMLRSENTSSLYGIFFAEVTANKVDIVIGEEAVLDMTISGVVAPGAYVTLNGIRIKEGGAVYLKTTRTVTAPLVRIGGNLTVEEGAKFIVKGYGGSNSLLRQEGGDILVMQDAVFHLTSENAYLSLIELVGSEFICNEPSSVLLYNANRTISAAGSPGTISLNTQQINYWDSLSEGGIDTDVLIRWAKPDGKEFVLNGTIATGSNGEFNMLTSNYIPGDPPGIAPDPSTFSIVKARILAFGRLELDVEQPTLNTTAIMGVTKPGAVVRVSYKEEGHSYYFPDVRADSDGRFRVPLDAALKRGSVVTVRSNKDYLTTTIQSEVNGEKNLELFVPDSIGFGIAEIRSKQALIRRYQMDSDVEIQDGRIPGSKWSLYIRLDKALIPDRSELPVLSSALVFIDNQGAEIPLKIGNEILIAEHATEAYEDIYQLSWKEDNGLLLSVNPGNAYANTSYTALLSWILVDVP